MVLFGERCSLVITDAEYRESVVHLDPIDVTDNGPSCPVTRSLKRMWNDGYSAVFPNCSRSYAEAATRFRGGVDAECEQVTICRRNFAAHDCDQIVLGSEISDDTSTVNRVVIGDDNGIQANTLGCL
jgi:hypothetical protein